MSMYGDSSYNRQKNNLYDELKWFLEDHPASELIQIVADVIRNETESEETCVKQTEKFVVIAATV